MSTLSLYPKKTWYLSPFSDKLSCVNWSPVDDTLMALVANGVQTLNSGDVIDGGAGNDTLIASFNNTQAQLIQPERLWSVENITVQGNGTADTTLNLAYATGLASITVKNTVALGTAVVFDRVKSVVGTLNLNNDRGGVVVRSDAVTGSNDAVAVNLSAFGMVRGYAPLLILPGYETLNIASNGFATNAATLSNLTDSYIANARVNVTGSASIALNTGLSTNKLTINAAGMSGAATLTLDACASLTSGGVAALVVGPSGADVTVSGTNNNDVFTFGTAAGESSYNTNDIIDGRGGNDTLRLTSGAASGASINQDNVTGVETLSLVNSIKAGSTISLANFAGVKNLTLEARDGANNATVKFGSGTSGLTFMESDLGTINLEAVGPAGKDLLNLTTNGGNYGTFNIRGFEFVKLIVNHPVTSIDAIRFDSAPGAIQWLGISGDSSVILHDVEAGSVDARSMAVPVTISGAPSSTIGISLVGGYGRGDHLTGGGGDDQLMAGPEGAASQGGELAGGGGHDTFWFGGSTLFKAMGISGFGVGQSGDRSGIVHLTDFVAGEDKIKLTTELGAGIVVLDSMQTIVTYSALTPEMLAAKISAIQDASWDIFPGGSLDNHYGWEIHAAVVQVTASNWAGTLLWMNGADTPDWQGASSGAWSGYEATDMLIDITGVRGTLSANDFIVV